jgi:type II secretory pathway predicted ATPase ExeA
VDHLHHFGLAEDPFRNDHHEKFAVETPSQTDALRRLDRGVRQARGLMALIGGVGAGKTMVARKLYEELEDEVFEASMMIVLRGSADADWLLTRFANQLGVDEPASEREALIGQIYERLAIIREDGRHAVLIVDDAQGLASQETLTEVCGLARLEYEDRRVLSIVLAGAPSLKHALTSDPLLAHHLEVQVTLPPFGREEAARYLWERIQLAGGKPQILLPGAVVGLHELSGGAPGRLNTLADNALFEAFLEDRNQMARSDVERAYADLGWGELGTHGDTSSASVAAASSTAPRGPGGNPSAEARQVLTAAPVSPASDVEDLDSKLEAVFEDEVPPTAPAPAHPADAGQTVLMTREASPPPTAQRSVPARAAAAPTEIQLEAQDAIPAPPKEPEEVDEVDDLFMELLDD